MKKILFTTDIFRISGDIPYYLDKYVYSVYMMFKEQIRLAIGKEPLLNYSRNTDIFDVQQFYSLCNYKYNEENWLKVSSGKITQKAKEYFISRFKDYFIITYHANPVMINLFQEYNIPYIDIFEGSVRFLEDIHFVMRSNDIEIYNKLLKYQYTEEEISMEAARLAASQKNFGLNDIRLTENSLLLCGQTSSDISLLVDNKYITLMDCEDKFREIVKNYDYIYYKPHPYCQDDEKNQEFIQKFSDFEICNYNFYSLMAASQIKGVAALSSGVLKEASYFHKNIHILSHLYVDYYKNESEIDINKFVILSTDYYSPTFWADVLSPKYNQVKSVKYFNFNNNSNFLRENIFHWWGYEIGQYAKIQHSLPESNVISYLPSNGKTTDNNIKDNDISVIVQGAVDAKSTKKCLQSIRKYLPKSQIILSTWENSDVTNLLGLYDKLVINKDPGIFDMESITATWKNNNVNRQIVSTINGIKNASRKYVLKFRSDMGLENLKFLRLYNSDKMQELKRERKYSIFKNRILIDSCFTRDSETPSAHKFCMHPSDLWFFGLKEDVENLFDIPLQSKYIVNIRGCNYQYRSPEQYIWTAFLRKQGWKFYMDSMLYNTPYLSKLSSKLIINNFFVINHKDSGVSFPRKFKTYKKELFEDVLDTTKYYELYKKFYDSNYKIPYKYRYSTIIDLLGIKKYVGKLKTLIKPFGFIYEIPLCIFKIILRSALNIYKFIWWLK